MSDETGPNPFAALPAPAPAATLEAAPGDRPSAWRTGDDVVSHLPAAWPPRCVHCNQPAAEQITMVTSWMPTWQFLLCWLSGFGLIAWMMFRIPVRLVLGVCAAHARERRTAERWALTGGGISGLVFGLAVVLDLPSLVPLALLGMFLATVRFVLLSRPVRVVGVVDGFVHARAGEAFLRSLPERR